MYSVIMTGYMFRNAQYRLELQESLEQVVALPDVQDNKVTLFLFLPFLAFCLWFERYLSVLIIEGCIMLNLVDRDLFIWTFGQVISYPY